MSLRELELVSAEVVVCRRCPRLVAWRERVAHEKVARYEDQEYWGRPVPGFGDANARVLVLGLAPAAHGGNRTGRIFTGDRSGEFLYPSLYRAGLSNRPASIEPGDGLRLVSTYITAVNRCAPPQNKPTTIERDNCLPYLERELAALERLRVIVALGSYAWDGALRALAAPEAAVRARGRDRGRALRDARDLSPEPAEHVHGNAHPGDAGRRARSRGRARRAQVAKR